jgi:conjugal transfer pilus assembly protein TraF
MKNRLVTMLCLVWFCSPGLFFSSKAFAFKFTPEICLKYGLGPNWYCEGGKENDKKPEQDLTVNDILNSQVPPEEKAIALNALWDRQLKRATISESKEDIEAFLETHNLITFKGINFSRNVQKVIDSSPTLSNTDSYLKSYTDEKVKQAEQKRILESSRGRYGIVFVYSTTCPHCSNQLPIILQFKEDFKFKVLGITTGKNCSGSKDCGFVVQNSGFNGLDENIVDQSITNDPLVQAYPTILLLDKKYPKKIFVAKGFTTLDELKDKIVQRIISREENEKN